MRSVFSDPPKGFRLNKFDIPLLVITTGLGIFYSDKSAKFSCLIPFVLYNFFLFCNVFRSRLIFEIFWGLTVVIHFYVTLKYFQFDWLRFVLIQGLFTIAVVLIDILTGKYRGIGYRYFQKGQRKKNENIVL